MRGFFIAFFKRLCFAWPRLITRGCKNDQSVFLVAKEAWDSIWSRGVNCYLFGSANDFFGYFQ